MISELLLDFQKGCIALFLFVIKEFHVEDALVEKREGVVGEIPVAMNRVAELIGYVTTWEIALILDEVGQIRSTMILAELKQLENLTDLLRLLKNYWHRVFDFIRLVLRRENIIDPFVDVRHIFFDKHVFG